MSALDLRDEHKDIFIDYYKHLPDEFLPLDVMEGPDNIPDGKWTREAWRAHLCKTFPRPHIPTKLTLKPGVSFQPPRFLFGWAMEYLEIRSIVERYRPNETLPVMDYQEFSMALTEIVRNRFPQIVDQLGWVIVDCVYVHGEGTYCCIALSDSWVTGNRKPTPEQISTLRDFFGIGNGGLATLADNEPMWWATRDSQHWHYRHKRDDLREYRPWDLRKRMSK